MPEFERSSDPGDALAYIAGRLSRRQKEALVRTIRRQWDEERPVLMVMNEHTARALESGPEPLALPEGGVRYLTPLGRDVARFLGGQPEQ